MSKVIGIAKIKKSIFHTKYFWGKYTDIIGQELRILEANTEGHCLCLAPEDKGLVDVHRLDIESIEIFPAPDSLVKSVLDAIFNNS